MKCTTNYLGSIDNLGHQLNRACEDLGACQEYILQDFKNLRGGNYEDISGKLHQLPILLNARFPAEDPQIGSPVLQRTDRCDLCQREDDVLTVNVSGEDGEDSWLRRCWICWAGRPPLNTVPERPPADNRKLKNATTHPSACETICKKCDARCMNPAQGDYSYCDRCLRLARPATPSSSATPTTVDSKAAHQTSVTDVHAQTTTYGRTEPELQAN